MEVVTVPTDKELLDFLQSIYALNTFDEYRLLVLRALQNLFGCDSAAFFLLRPNKDKFIEPIHIELDEKCFQNYEHYYHRFDLYKNLVFSQHPIPSVDRASDFLDYHQWEKNEHRVDFLLQNRMYHLACIQLFDQDGLLTGEISLHRNRHRSDFTNDEMKYLQLLAPHLQGSLHNQLQHRETVRLNEVLLRALSSDEHGIIVLDQSYKPLIMNQQAEYWQKTLNTDTRQYFWQELKQSCRFLAIAQHDNLSAPLSQHYSFYFNNHLIHIHLHPISEGGSVLAYFICKMSHPVQISDTDDFSNSNKNLTPKEYQVYQLILQGKTNLEIANNLYISIHTVKTHLKSILQKYEVHSRIELIGKCSNRIIK